MAKGEQKEMARLIVAKKTENGSYQYRERMVPREEVQEKIREAKK